MLLWLMYLAAGKIMIFVGQKFLSDIQLPAVLSNSKFIKTVLICDLCFGVWVYTLLAWLFGLDLMLSFGAHSYYPVLNEFITGSVCSYIVHIFFIGMRARYEVINI